MVLLVMKMNSHVVKTSLAAIGIALAVASAANLASHMEEKSTEFIRATGGIGGVLVQFQSHSAGWPFKCAKWRTYSYLGGDRALLVNPQTLRKNILAAGLMAVLSGTLAGYGRYFFEIARTRPS